jgi:RNA polymerase sigma-54 factor
MAGIGMTPSAVARAPSTTPLSPYLEMVHSPTLVISPLLVARMHMLAIPSIEFEREVMRELDEDPALELDGSACTTEPGCPVCDGASASRSSAASSSPIADVPQVRDGRDVLREMLRGDVPSRLRAVADEVVDGLDDNGFLEEPPARIAERTGSTRAAVELVLSHLPNVAPVGVGAGGLREALLAQLDASNEEAPVHTRAILDRHLEALAKGGDRTIARLLDTSEEAIHTARSFILRRLDPRPLLAIVPDPTHRAAAWSRPQPPDVVVRNDAGELRVEVSERHRFPLRIHPLYQELARRLIGPDDHVELDASEATHVLDHVARAGAFVARTHERWRTIETVSGEIVARQEPFVLGRTRAPNAMTRADVADAIGIHPSTVWRATTQRTLRTPSGRTLALDLLFDPAFGAREELRDIIATEPRPMSDSELARELRRRGVPLARRTVAKYRASIGVPASTAR